MFWLCRSCNRQTHSHSTYLGCKSNQIRFEIWENRINGQYSSFLLSNTIDAELMRKIENFLQILNFKSVKTFLFSLKLWHKPFVPLQDNLLRQDSFQDGKKQFWQFWFVQVPLRWCGSILGDNYMQWQAVVLIKCNNNLMQYIRGFVCAYHPSAPGSNPKHTI